MDRRQLSDASEHSERCRQFAGPISPLYNDVSVDGLSLPPMQSSLWSYSPSLSYQQVCRSDWGPAESGCPLVGRDTLNQSPHQHRPINEASHIQGSDLSHRWRKPDSTAALVGGGLPYRAVNGPVCDMAQSSLQPDELNLSPTTFTHCRPSPAVIAGKSPDHFLASSDTGMQHKLDSSVDHTCRCQGYKTVPVLPQTAGWHCCGFQCCDKLHRFPVVEPRAVASNHTAASHIYAEDLSPVTCKLHSVRCATSPEEAPTHCCDVHGAASALRLHHHFHPSHQQSMFTTNCCNTDFMSYGMNSEQFNSNLCTRQSASMNDLDDIELPLHNSSSIPTEVVESTVSASSRSHSVNDTGFVTTTKPDNALSHSRKREQWKDIIDKLESSGQAAAGVCETRSDLDAENSVKDVASTSLPSDCPKLPLMSKKSRKKLLRAADEKSSRPVPTKRTVHNDRCNLAAFDGAIDSTLCSTVSEHADGTANVESNTGCGAAVDRTRKNSLLEETNESEIHCATTECSEDFAPETDKLSHSSGSRLRTECRPRPETQTGMRHHRRSVRKTLSRPATKQKSTRRDQNQDQSTSSRLKWLLLSVDWQQQHQNIGMSFSALMLIVGGQWEGFRPINFYMSLCLGICLCLGLAYWPMFLGLAYPRLIPE